MSLQTVRHMSQLSDQSPDIPDAEPEPRQPETARGFDPYNSDAFKRLVTERRRTLDDMRMLDQEIRLARAQSRFRAIRYGNG